MNWHELFAHWITPVIEERQGDVSTTMREGETKTFTLAGIEYEITLIFVSDPNSGTAEAKFMVNGEVIFSDNVYSGAHPGRLLRHGSA